MIRTVEQPRLEWNAQTLQIVLTVLCGLSLVVSWLVPESPAAVLSALFGAPFAVAAAWESLRSRTVDVNFLMLFAAVAAVAIGATGDAAALLFLFALSGTLERYAMGRTESAIASLIRLRPDTATLVSPDGDAVVPVEMLKIGDLVRVSPFQQVPADGAVVDGRSTVDQQAMTGESSPVPKAPGDPVTAGTQNLEGSLLVRVGAEIGNSTLDRIVNLVRDAQENRASGERISQWFGTRYTVFVVLAFAVSLSVRLGTGAPMDDALLSALTLLVALSPCALVISIPAATLSALAWAGRHGVLVRGGSVIEEAGKVTAVAVDKTGTLTLGKPRFVEVFSCVPEACVWARTGVCETGSDTPCQAWTDQDALSQDQGELLRIAAGVEGESAHPIATALHAAVAEHGLAPVAATDHRAVPGFGVEAVIDGRPARLGQLGWFEQTAALPAVLKERTRDMQARGLTVTMLEYGERYAVFGFRDGLRKEAAEFVRTLRQLGVKKIVMLTGDHPDAARPVAEATGVDEVAAGLLPGEKASRIQALKDAGYRTLMVGDGINDAPSLATADVAVAMGGEGSDIALQSADAVLMRDRLDAIPDLIRLGRRTQGIIRANLVFAVGVIAVLALSSIFTRLPLPLAVLGHEGSTVLVILNGLRLLSGPGRM